MHSLFEVLSGEGVNGMGEMRGKVDGYIKAKSLSCPLRRSMGVIGRAKARGRSGFPGVICFRKKGTWGFEGEVGCDESVWIVRLD